MPLASQQPLGHELALQAVVVGPQLAPNHRTADIANSVTPREIIRVMWRQTPQSAAECKGVLTIREGLCYGVAAVHPGRAP